MKIVIGSYGTPPRPLASEEEFELLTSGALALDEVDGLEVPYFGGSSPWQNPAYLARSAGSHVLTTIPAMMADLPKRPALGLASVDDDSRREAVALIRSAREFVEQVNSSDGRSIDAVQLHSAPGRHLSSADAFARSLEEIRSWDWKGAELAIEHCDADTGLHKPSKGFLSLEQELAIATSQGIGIVINWGRSAIETRDAEGPATHIAAAVSAGALTGLILSGCASVESAYGAAFDDRHVPIRGWGAGPLSDAADASILTIEQAQRCVALALQAPQLRFLGVKVKAPAIAGPSEWLDVVGGNLRVLTEAARTSTSAIL
ncbi:DUF4862 family protein [Microbacterium sp. AK031]|uniref:DUF4862 family protein n=1 Tax=Microbacterium sp. AK031 TaxID=2723076 RepID=UPI002167CC1F|nr:DUF4862 family protein [Microbacterium sp. AK031]MCS3843388.1 hypothetical protein [Microbacterium sp. AK031]